MNPLRAAGVLPLLIAALTMTACSEEPAQTQSVDRPSVVGSAASAQPPGSVSADPEESEGQADTATGTGVERSVDTASDGTLVATGDQASFVMPSGNIQCVIRTESVVCQVAEKDFTPQDGDMSPDVLGDCGPERADSLTLVSGAGTGWTCHTESIRGQAGLDLGGWWATDGVGETEEVDGTPLAVLSYGQELQVGSMLCRSESTGISCRDLTSADGFSLAREAYTVG